MRKELDDSLCQRHPEIFSERHGDPRQTCMTRGFACEDGWFGLIDSLCTQLDELTRGGESTVAGQVKEKFGTLRFSITGSEEAQALCRATEVASANVCEKCGATPASMSALNGIYRTRCPACYDELRKEILLQGTTYDFYDPDEITSAMYAPRYHVLRAFAEIFGLRLIKEKWAALEATEQGAPLIQQVRGIIGTLEEKGVGKKVDDLLDEMGDET